MSPVRRRYARMVPAALAILLLAAPPTRAADAAGRLESRPAGIHVALDGPVSVSGTTPFPLEDLPPGAYRLVIGGTGLPTARGRAVLGPDGGFTTGRGRGAATLLLPPGFAHLQDGERGRGLVLLGAEAVFLGAAAVKDFHRRDASDDLAAAQRRYDEAVSGAAVLEARADLLEATERTDDEEELRNLWLAGAGALWLGAALETWILTPAPEAVRGDAAGDVVVLAPRGSRAGAAVRSLLLPGAGQRYMGDPGRGSRFTAAVALLGAAGLVVHEGYLDSRREQNAAQRHYDLADTESEAKRWRGRLEDAADEARDRERLQWALWGAAAAVHVWNVLDAARFEAGAASGTDWSWRLVPHRDGMRAGLTWRIG